jgi:hypothetical protein
LKANYKKTFGRDRPLPMTATNLATGAVTNVATPPVRNDPRKGAEVQMSRALIKPGPDATNLAVTATDPRIITRTTSLPALAPDDQMLAQMESELHAHANVTPDDTKALMQARAQSVQRALLKTEKVTAERLFILAPPAADTAAKRQLRVNLSLN